LARYAPAGLLVWLSIDVSARWDLVVVWLKRGPTRDRTEIRSAHLDLTWLLLGKGADGVTVMIGIDPHKGSHTAVVINATEGELGRLRVRASARQVEQLLAWAQPYPTRIWAVESANGWGYLLSQQLLSVGERVVDVPATLAARVRVLSSGRSNKNDPNDARSVAVAALRSPGLREVARTDHQEVLRLLAKRSHDLARARNRTACRLHALLAELVPGGVAGEISATTAQQLLAGVEVRSPVEATRRDIATEHLEDLRRLDAQIKAAKARIRTAVAATNTSLTDLFGVGPFVAAIIIGHTGDIGRFRTRDHYAAYTGTAPIEVSSGGRVVHRLSRRGNRKLNHAIHIAAVSQIRHRNSQGRVFYDRKIAEGKTTKEALRALKRRISDAVYRQLQADADAR
jgi:transposase